MSTCPRELADLLRRYEADVQSTAVALRTAVIDEIGPCYEAIFPINKWISVLYSTTEKRIKDSICLIVVYRDHVNLLFTRGVDLKDPKGLLEGTGRAMRHVKMHLPDDASRRGVRQLIRQACRRPDLGKPGKPLKKVVTTLRAKAAKKPAPAWPRLF